MAYTVPHTIITGELVTVATMNNEWGGNVSFLANPPACRVYNSAAFSHNSSGNFLAITFDSERFDTNTMHSTSSNTSRITINTAGLYMLNGVAEWAGNATGVRVLGIRLNGSTIIALPDQTNSGASVVRQEVTTIYKFAATDYVELIAWQNSGGTLAINAAGNWSPEFSAVWIGLG